MDELKVALLGLPSAGKTVYLASLTRDRTAATDYTWTAVCQDRATVAYLRGIWDQVMDGQAVAGTLPSGPGQELKLRITGSGRRRGGRRVFMLECRDTSGETWTTFCGAGKGGSRSAVSTESVEAVRADVQSADGLILLVDSLELLFRRTAERRDELAFGLQALAVARGERRLPLAVVFSKADLLSKRLTNNPQRLFAQYYGDQAFDLIPDTFACWNAFTISVMGDSWRWNLEGKPVVAQPNRVRGQNLFAPFSWLGSLPIDR